ncbi:hypothetical protein JG688_00013867 [Phytophthora aleatoria]|uniref:Uncharacterized protein n=1 Tax=Phytophthora aleatoria TaxID=2496075 RepID=A0A8J5ME84_9STRA|nr:hypothetical protein JG688_00013867 [Phytophthora aleatoria]
MQVKPWFSSKPSCSFLVINCYKSKISGMEDEIDALWSPFDPSTISSLVIRHCSRLEIPSKLTEFSGLKYLKVYNSTILNWQEDAAISQVHHPSLLMLFLVRVNMTNCELPADLYRDQLPITLRDIEICMTNMRTLPDDLDLTWPHFATIYIEASNLTDVPPSLVRLAPFDFSLALNPISSIPALMIEGNAGYLHVGGTLISDLPEVVHDASPYFKIRLDNTNVSFFWEWIDPMVENADSSLAGGIPIILATNSPYCLDLQHIYDGQQPSFSTPMHKGQSKLLADASVENWPTLQKAVVCDEWPATYYPIEFEDEYSRVH